MIRFCDLFAGIGGIRAGFQQACEDLGIENECGISVEINKRACETYALNFGDNPYGDVSAIDRLHDCDFVLAGFPCQSFSYAGRKQGFGDTRGTLFFELERLLKATDPKPKGFLLENVRGLTTNDGGRTLETISNSLESLGYGMTHLLLNSCSFGVPQNRVRVYILGLLGSKPTMTMASDLGPADSHKFKDNTIQGDLFGRYNSAVVVEDILEHNVDAKYHCSRRFTNMLRRVVGSDFGRLNGVRLIDYRGGNSIHSWELGLKGRCSEDEINLMNRLIENRRKSAFGTHQDGKMLTLEQIKTFYTSDSIESLVRSLVFKGYLRDWEGKYNPVCGNMSFEVYKFLDPRSISVTLVSSDAHKLGVVQNNAPRRITPRECARLQGFPETYEIHTSEPSAYRQFGNSVTVPVIRAVVKDFLSNNWS